MIVASGRSEKDRRWKPPATAEGAGSSSGREPAACVHQFSGFQPYRPHGCGAWWRGTRDCPGNCILSADSCLGGQLVGGGSGRQAIRAMIAVSPSDASHAGIASACRYRMLGAAVGLVSAWAAR